MKTTGIISALVFAHAAFAQASDSSSVAVSATSSASAAASTTSASASAAIAGTSSSAAASSAGSSSASASNTKTGTKSASYGAGTTATPTSSSVYNNASGGSSTSIALAETQAPASSGNPLVPDSASSDCTTYLNKLNSDTVLSSCLNPLITAMSAFTSGSGSASALTKSLNNLCASSGCSASMMRSKLTEFKDACSAELTGATPDPTVVQNYDTMYAMYPFKDAMCSKDADTQAYCVLNIGTGSSTTGTTSNIATGPSESVAFAAAHLEKAYVRKRASGQTVVVNPGTYRTTNLMYLFTSPDMNAGELCTSCTQQIVSKYVAFESSTPYALGLKNSPLLGGQSDLWTAIQEKCPASFLTEVTNIAGAGTANQVSAASPAHTGSLITALAGLVAAGFAVI